MTAVSVCPFVFRAAIHASAAPHPTDLLEEKSRLSPAFHILLVVLAAQVGNDALDDPVHGNNGDDRDDHVLHHVGDPFSLSCDLFPSLAGGGAERAQDGVPHRGTKKREQSELGDVHTCHAGGDGDQAAHHGDAAADKNRRLPLAVKPVDGARDVGPLEPQQAHGARVEEAHEALAVEHVADTVQDKRAGNRPDRGGHDDQRQYHVGRGGEEARERQDELARNGRKDVFDEDKSANGKIAELADEVEKRGFHVPPLAGASHPVVTLGKTQTARPKRATNQYRGVLRSCRSVGTGSFNLHGGRCPARRASKRCDLYLRNLNTTCW